MINAQAKIAPFIYHACKISHFMGPAVARMKGLASLASKLRYNGSLRLYHRNIYVNNIYLCDVSEREKSILHLLGILKGSTIINDVSLFMCTLYR